MANQSNKKEKKSINTTQYYLKGTIYSITILYLIIFAYSYFLSGNEIKRSDILGFLFLSLMNYVLYNLIIILRDAFYVNYIWDILIINLAVMVLINFHWKFWFFYLIIPGYLLVQGGLYLFEYTKSIGKEDPNQVEENSEKSNKKKIKYEKIKH
jgi:hypothetical protein